MVTVGNVKGPAAISTQSISDPFGCKKLQGGYVQKMVPSIGPIVTNMMMLVPLKTKNTKAWKVRSSLISFKMRSAHGCSAGVFLALLLLDRVPPPDAALFAMEYGVARSRGK